MKHFLLASFIAFGLYPVSGFAIEQNLDCELFKTQNRNSVSCFSTAPGSDGTCERSEKAALTFCQTHGFKTIANQVCHEDACIDMSCGYPRVDADCL